MPASRPGIQTTDDDPRTQFQRDIVRMLLTFFAVVAIDVVVMSLMQGRLRFWFPMWLDPGWAERAAPWVVYSQSYFAGIFMIPLLLRAVDREFIVPRGASARAVFWAIGVSVMAFVAWWKGGLMLQYHKHFEALGWMALTGMVWVITGLAHTLPQRAAALGRRQLLGTLLLGVSVFFLVMALLDPLVQLRVQHLGWSSGLIIEVGFFVPAGLVCLTVGRRLRRPATDAVEASHEGADVRIRHPSPDHR